MAQLVAILAGMENRMNAKMDGNTRKMEGIKNNMEGMEANTRRMESNMEANTQTLREEMQCMGAGLQDGLDKLKKGNGELLRATCWATEERGPIEVTEEVTVTETYTREIRHVEVTELVETREIGKRLHGAEAKDAHTHTVSGGQWG